MAGCCWFRKLIRQSPKITMLQRISWFLLLHRIRSWTSTCRALCFLLARDLDLPSPLHFRFVLWSERRTMHLFLFNLYVDRWRCLNLVIGWACVGSVLTISHGRPWYMWDCHYGFRQGKLKLVLIYRITNWGYGLCVTCDPSVLAVAQTAAFALATLEKLLIRPKPEQVPGIRVLVLTPTRERALL